MDEGAENCIARSREVLATTAHRILQGDFRGKRGSKCFSCDYRDICSVFRHTLFLPFTEVKRPLPRDTRAGAIAHTSVSASCYIFDLSKSPRRWTPSVMCSGSAPEKLNRIWQVSSRRG